MIGRMDVRRPFSESIEIIFVLGNNTKLRKRVSVSGILLFYYIGGRVCVVGT
jgi:hypothetical protein